MTESDALTKWCPMARAMAHAGPNTVAANRFGQGSKDYINCKCIASDCMMFRRRKIIPDATYPGTFEYDYYCGLAGKP